MILAVLRTSWLNLRRDRGALLLSFVVPIVFFSIFAGIFGAQRSGTSTVKLAVVDEDHSERSEQLLQALRDETALRIVEAPKKGEAKFTATTAEAYVRAGSAPVALIIPAGFSKWQLQFGRGKEAQPALRLLADAADLIADQVVDGMLQKTIMTSMPDMMVNGGTEAMDKWGVAFTPEQRAAIDRGVTQLNERKKQSKGAAGAGDGSLIKIQKTDLMGQSKKNSVVALYAAGIGVMFLLFTATNAGGALLEENESGTLDRVLTTRVSFLTLLAGKFAYLWSLGFVQLCVMFVWAAVIFKLELAQHIGGFLLMATATTAATSAFGLLLASVCRTRAQLAAISTLVVLTISALGGSMFPRFLMPEAMQKAGLVLFNSWALEGFTNVFWREEPLSTIVLPIAVLLAFAAVFFAAARQMTRRWEVS